MNVFQWGNLPFCEDIILTKLMKATTEEPWRLWVWDWRAVSRLVAHGCCSGLCKISLIQQINIININTTHQAEEQYCEKNKIFRWWPEMLSLSSWPPTALHIWLSTHGQNVSNHRQLDCLINSLLRLTAKTNSTLIALVRGIHRWSLGNYMNITWWRHKRLSKQSGGWWFETPSRPLWRHCNGHGRFPHKIRCCDGGIAAAQGDWKSLNYGGSFVS